MLALEEATETLGWAHGVVHHLNAVATSPELRAADLAIQPPLSKFFSSIVLNPEVWKAVCEYAGTEEAGRRDPDPRAFLVRSGLAQALPILGASAD